MSPTIAIASTAQSDTSGAQMFSLTEMPMQRTTVCMPEIPCRTTDADLWFAESPEDVELAKAMCVECPLRVQCLDGALERREPWGVWGGQLFVQGAIVARKRPRGRPRKTEIAA